MAMIKNINVVHTFSIVFIIFSFIVYIIYKVIRRSVYKKLYTVAKFWSTRIFTLPIYTLLNVYVFITCVQKNL